DRARRVARDRIDVAADKQLSVFAELRASRHRRSRGRADDVDVGAELRPRVVVVDDDVLVGDEVNVERELPEEGVLLNRAGGGDAARAQGGEQTANDRERFTIRTLQYRHRSGELSRRRRGA